jgi:hypothetical protein
MKLSRYTRFLVSEDYDLGGLAGSEWREIPADLTSSAGFVPYEAGGDLIVDLDISVYLLQFRLDEIELHAPTLKTRIKEREQALCREAGVPKLSRYERAELAEVVRAEMIANTPPRTTLVPILLDSDSRTLLIATTSKKLVDLVALAFETATQAKLTPTSPLLRARARDLDWLKFHYTDILRDESGVSLQSQVPDDYLGRLDLARKFGPDFLLYLLHREREGGADIAFSFGDCLKFKPSQDPLALVSSAMKGEEVASSAVAHQAILRGCPIAEAKLNFNLAGTLIPFSLAADTLAVLGAKLPVSLAEDEYEAILEDSLYVERLESAIDEAFVSFLDLWVGEQGPPLREAMRGTILNAEV